MKQSLIQTPNSNSETQQIVKRLKKILLGWVRKLFHDLHSAIVSIVVTVLVFGGGGSYISSENIRIAIHETMLSPTPIWVSTALVFLVVVYVYWKNRKVHSNKKPNFDVAFFTIGGAKWKIKIYEDWFEVDEYPFCAKHDVQFIFAHNKKHCPGILGERCDNNLSDRKYFEIYESVKSMVESKIRNKEELR